MAFDRKYMERAIALAKKGVGAVNPNPLVGAGSVKDPPPRLPPHLPSGRSLFLLQCSDIPPIPAHCSERAGLAAPLTPAHCSQHAGLAAPPPPARCSERAGLAAPIFLVMASVSRGAL